jgi:hypothetical protein
VFREERRYLKGRRHTLQLSYRPINIPALLLFAIFTATSFSVSFADAARDTTSEWKAKFHRTLNTAPVQGEIKIDGDLNDPGWKNATRADNFVETNPGDQVTPTMQSAALITYDESNLYVALIAYDDPKAVRVALRERDNIFQDDYFGVMLSTYGDIPWGYELFSNPIGIQGDLRMTSDGNEDETFNIVYYTEGKVTDSGYQIEFAIPFSSLRFPNTEEQNWRIQFWRDQQREIRRRYAWTAQERGNPCWMCHFGYLTGIKGIKPSSNIDIIPSALSFQSGSRIDPGTPNSQFDNEKIDAEAALNVRYGITSNSSAEIAINPDFSQIESDAAQVDVNSTFGLYYTERRPFFQEGSELFSTWVSGVYTRSINNPLVAGKLTGQFGRWCMAYLTGYDENSPVTIPLFEQSVQGLFGKSVSNIFRVKRSIGADSHIGALVTNRQLADYDEGGSTGGSGTTFGIDTKIRLHKRWHIEWQTLGSYTQEPVAPDFVDTSLYSIDTSFVIDTMTNDTTDVVVDSSYSGIAQSRFNHDEHTVALDGENYWGAGTYFSLERSGKVWNFDYDYEDYTPTFRADNGFVTQAGYRAMYLWTGWFMRPNKGWLLNVEPSVSLGRIWNHEAQFTLSDRNPGVKDEWVRPGLFLEFKGQTTFYSEVLFSCERFGMNQEFFTYIRRGYFELNTRPFKTIGFGGWVNVGTGIYRDRVNPELGNQTNAGGYVNLRPTQQLFISPEIEFAKLDHRDDYMQANPDSAQNVYKGFIVRSRVTYQFTREMNLRVIVQYNDFSDRFDLEPMFSYKINPFTVFYLGVNSKFQHFNRTDYSLAKSETELSERQFFAKFQYLIRM